MPASSPTSPSVKPDPGRRPKFVTASLWLKISPAEANILHVLAAPYIAPDAPKRAKWLALPLVDNTQLRRLLEKGLLQQRPGPTINRATKRPQWLWTLTEKGWTAIGYTTAQAARYLERAAEEAGG